MTALRPGNSFIPDHPKQPVTHISLCSFKANCVLNLSPLSFGTAFAQAGLQAGHLPTKGRMLFSRGKAAWPHAHVLPKPPGSSPSSGKSLQIPVDESERHVWFFSSDFFFLCYVIVPTLLNCFLTQGLQIHLQITSASVGPTTVLNLFLNC